MYASGLTCATPKDPTSAESQSRTFGSPAKSASSDEIAGNRMPQRDVYKMVKRPAKDSRLEAAVGCCTYRATGITNYLTHGGTLEKAQQLANHESARTTKL